MLSAYSHVCFALLLAVFCHAQALAPSHNNNNLASRVFGNETQCSWNCTAIESDLTEEMKITVDSKETPIQLVVKYEKKVDDKCVNQTSRNSSGNATEHLQKWLENKQRSTLAKLMESLKNLMFTNSNEERKAIRVLCTLRPSKTTGTTSEYNKEIQFPLFSRGHLAALAVDLNTTGLNTTSKGDLEPRENIINSTDGNSGWSVALCNGLCIVFTFVLLYYSPFFLCLLSPTEVTEDGIRQIILERASPVSFQSRIGNYFFSEDDGTIWHKAKTFIFRVIIIPLPFLCIGIYNYEELPCFLQNNFLGGYIVVCCVCYLIQAFYISFFTMRSVQKKPCIVCKYVRPKNFSCQGKLPLLIIGHLRLQPLILVKCWRLFIQYMSHYFKMTLILLPSGNVSFVDLLHISAFILSLPLVPFITVILSIMILLLAFIGIVSSSPLLTLCNARHLGINVPYFISRTIHYIFSCLAGFGIASVIAFAQKRTLMALLLGMDLFSEEILPYLAFIVLIFYYVWTSYDSFTNSYQDFALALLKHYQKLQPDMDVSRDQVQQRIAAQYEDDEIKIPKRLFQMACEELMPIREGFCKMILKIITIALFVGLVSSSIARLRSEGATHFMKALLTFVTGSFPKIAIIYIDGDRKKKIKAMATDKKIPKIVQEYMKRRAVTIRSNHAQDNCDADGNAEVILLNDNEENSPLINI